jgi:hypothetical protein
MPAVCRQTAFTNSVVAAMGRANLLIYRKSQTDAVDVTQTKSHPNKGLSELSHDNELPSTSVLYVADMVIHDIKHASKKRPSCIF